MTNKFEIIKTRETWQKALHELPEFPGKAYYSFDYISACQKLSESIPVAALLKKDNQNCVFYPFLLRKIPEQLGKPEAYDIETAYGYGGPFFSNFNTELVSCFFDNFCSWAREMNVVAEFVRFNPLCNFNHLLTDVYQISLNRRTVVIPLEPDFSRLLQQCIPARRRNFQKAAAENLHFKTTTRLDEFKKLYQITMKRVKADSFYFFSDAYFRAIENLPEDQRLFALVCLPTEETVAAGIFLIDQDSIHYHLGASADNFQNLQAGPFMMLKTAEKAALSGKKLMHLGGGLSLSDDDRLFRYKKGFSDKTLEFFIGRRIHQPELYNELSKKWQEITGSRPGILLHYHYGLE